MNETETSQNLPAKCCAGELIQHERYQRNAPLTKTIEAWQTKMQEERYRKLAAASAAVSRKKYRLEREAAGESVRPYHFHNHEPWKFGETHESRERRLHRDRMRTMRGVDESTVRTWTDLSGMSDEDRANRRKTQATARKARERKRKQPLPQSDVICADTATQTACVDGIEWGMF
uniref:hypothetical protein n=1 Tax=uncultured Rhizobium sp. TaxID=155567 RepID=UPI0026181017|nr:hypothetical protein [uncultured Rhizobium sp.]